VNQTNVTSTHAHYQVVIVGTDLAGLVLGALCAKKGYRVLVVGQGSQGSLYEHGGYTMCRRPELVHGLASPPVRRVFEELSLGLELRNLPKPIEPAFQVVLPRSRINASTDPRLFERELQREFPNDAKDIETFFRRVHEIDEEVEELLKLRPNLPPVGVVETFKFRRLVKRFPFLDDEWAIEDPLSIFPHGHPFRAFALAAFRFTCGMLPARPYPATFVRSITELFKGAWTFDQGPNTLRSLFLNMVAAGGDVLPRGHVQQIEVQRGKATQVVLRDKRQIGCDLLVCNTDPKRFAALIPQEQQNDEYHHTIHTLQPVYYTFVGNFVVRARAIPEAMARHVFAVADLTQPLEEDNLVHIARDLDVAVATDDREVRLVTAAMRVPLNAASGGVAAAEVLLDRLQRRVEDTLPFLGEHLLARHTPWVRTGDDAGDEDVDPNELQPAYGEAIPHTLGTSPIATATGYRNILMGSDAAFAGLGTDGPYVAALNMFGQVLERVPLKSVF
jgi:phytoene dehydrogenase-like protein